MLMLASRSSPASAAAPPSPFKLSYGIVAPPEKIRSFAVFPTRRPRLEALFPSFPLPRRLFFPTVSASVWDFLTSGNSAQDASISVRRGMQLFREGDVGGSLVEFDRAIELDPRQKAYLWQRGLSLYYANRFEEGAEQFRLDVAANPNDTEESIWCFLCEAQLYGPEEARKSFLEASLKFHCIDSILSDIFLQVGRDPRPVMREAYDMFKDGGDPEKFSKNFISGSDNEYFYASLYAGLYYESQNDTDSARRHIVAACQSTYGSRSNDYMAALAKVHCSCRGWSKS
ncbi:hypothetical protein ZIOFF_020805 [Zingiber officinale]|uniref:Uncharacterized protein n=1 Tax=Zingiber officinale TaxID=94328 RepID=A0A8J5LGS5_ZINOF|nr:hypothetical protein ZIOFF_020805 [Zingiber officinale]